MAPGTWGSAGAAAVFLVVHRVCPVWGGSLLVGGGLLLGYGACRRALPDLSGSDPDRVVIDEILGQWVALWGLIGITEVRPVTLGVLAGFFVFRAFDVFKVPPARQAETIPGPWGVLLDDVVAGIYTSFTLFLVRFWGFLA